LLAGRIAPSAKVQPEHLEILFVVFDIVYLDGEVLKALPLRIRLEKLASALKVAPKQGIVLEGGQTAITGRIVPVLPDSAGELVPGFPPSQLWSVSGSRAADIQVGCPPEVASEPFAATFLNAKMTWRLPETSTLLHNINLQMISLSVRVAQNLWVFKTSAIEPFSIKYGRVHAQQELMTHRHAYRHKVVITAQVVVSFVTDYT
jgi:hypothetical protein